MYCRKCGTLNDDNAFKCVNCGEVLREQAEPAPVEQIPNYLTPSILVTVFCCLPLGIPAIVYAAQVNAKIQAGDVAGAKESSRRAKLWSWWSFGIGLASVVIWILVSILAAAMG
jgi:hypothetical protein